MSGIATPAAHAERRDGPGQGTFTNQATVTESGVRAALLLAGILPAAAMAVLGCATVGFLHFTDLSLATTRVVLLVAAAAAALILAGAYFGAEAAARPLHDQLIVLRSLTARGADELRNLVERVKRGERCEPRNAAASPAGTSDPFELLAHDLHRIQCAAQHAVLAVADMRPGTDQRVEVFVNLAWRMQSLVHREIQLLDELEAQVEDPELLKGLFTVDHLATLLRRQTESLAVLGGAASRRRWSNPVTMYDVLRSAVAEVEQYSRVKLVLPIDGMLHGDAVAHIIHLVAELVENATKFSPPESQVLIRAENVTAGLAIEVEDRGLGISSDDRHRMNEVLADPSRVDIGELLRDGRIGLFVVSALARIHGVRVELQRNVYGGTQAIVVLPQGLVDPAARDRQAQSVAIAATGATAATLVQAAAPTASPGSPPASAPTADTLARTQGGPQSSAQGDPQGSTQSVSQGDGAERPALPQRQVQHSLAPQLRETPAPRKDGPNADHTPDLMADFLRGVSRSDEENRPMDNPGGAS